MSSAERRQPTTPPPATPPPPVESFDENNDESTDNIIYAAMDAKFMADAEQKTEEEPTAHAMFDAEQGRRWEAAAAEDDFSEFEWSSDSDGPDPEEKAAEQRALVESCWTLKKVENVANEALQQHLLEDVAVHRALAIARRMERRAAEELMRREGGNDGVGPSTAPRGDN